MTLSASYWTPRTCTAASSALSIRNTGHTCFAWLNTCWRTGANQTKASGRRVRADSTMSSPRLGAGWPWTAQSRWWNALDLDGDRELWERVRGEIREEILTNGFNEERGVFVQSYGSDLLDAANLMLPLIGFIKADDPRMLATIRATQSETHV